MGVTPRSWTATPGAGPPRSRTVWGGITTPYLVMSYQLENLFPGEAQALYSLLPGRKTLATLTTAEGAEYHDAPMAPEKHNQVVFDWMDTTLGV